MKIDTAPLKGKRCSNFYHKSKVLTPQLIDHVFRLFESNPEIREIFPTFKGLMQEEIINSRSLHLHAKRVMGALENAVLALNDAEVFSEYLMNLGERHLPWPVKMEHFDVCILFSKLDNGSGGGGVLEKFIYGEVLPGIQQFHLFIEHFRQKR